ncbi:MAG: undecaprenyl/decaprenyl-phosphate alpha-N-acetylglucosaminyl 1-phosphate transferase, partial [Bacteroidaceae bacterium]|nr:undecaprenyl/decaprenyl-phosphate alpha-N-acetylglucosaminyl 1-phosphate transferase [Bacteroidaceae bacterium]
MISIHNIIVPFLVAFVATLWIHPKVLKIAIMKNLVDNPDARKLQRNPTPVMGGIAVFFGLILGLASSQIISTSYIFIYSAVMMIMLYVGTIDDILNLSPKLRLIIEIAVIGLLIFVTDGSINNFFGM